MTSIHSNESREAFIVILSSLQQYAQDAQQYCTVDHVKLFLKRHVPILEWLPTYDMTEDLQYDLLAGVTVGMMIIPQEISLAAMMGVPPIYGLYTAAVVPMIYPLFGTSRVLSVANGAEVSLLVGSAIKKIESVEERVATGILLSFLCGLMMFFMGIFRLGVIADFFSRPVMGGFISAGGVLIMLSQCGKWLGVHIPSRDLPFLTVLDLIEGIWDMDPKSFILGLITIGMLGLMRVAKRGVICELQELEEALSFELEKENEKYLETLARDEADERKDREKITADNNIDLELGESRVKPRLARLKLTRQPSALSSRIATPKPQSLLHLTSSPSMREAIASVRTMDHLNMTRTSRNRMFVDEKFGFSLSDEDFLTLEKQDPEDTVVGVPGTPGRLFAHTPRRTVDNTTSQVFTTKEKIIQKSASIDSDISDEETKLPSRDKRQVPSSVMNFSHHRENFSLTDSTRSSTALTGANVNSYPAFTSVTIRKIRSQIAGLIGLRLICDLGPFFVCFFGGMIGFLAGKDHFALTETVPGGYPSLQIPWYGLRSSDNGKTESLIETDRLYHIVIDALSIGIISYMTSIAMAKRLAMKEGYKVRPNQELIALGLSNIIGACFQGMPATGGLSRTAVNMQNARTQLASLISVSVVVITLYTATSVLGYLPQASVAAIIIVAGQSLIELKEAKWLYRVKREEFYVWTASFVFTILLGVLPGLLSSIFCSLVAVIYKTRRPTVTFLGELLDNEDTDESSNTESNESSGTPTNKKKKRMKLVELERYGDQARALNDIIVLRVEGALYFANCDFVAQVIEKEVIERQRQALLPDSETPVQFISTIGVVIDACAILDWDSTTLQMMKQLKEELLLQNIRIAIVNARESLQHLLESTEYVNGIIKNDARIGFQEAIEEIRQLAGDENINSESKNSGSTQAIAKITTRGQNL